MTKVAGGWGQMGELPDQVTETGGQSLSQRPLPQPPPPPGWRDSCLGEDGKGIHCISLSLCWRPDLGAPVPSPLRTWEPRTLVPSSLRPRGPGPQPLLPQAPSLFLLS